MHPMSWLMHVSRDDASSIRTLANALRALPALCLLNGTSAEQAYVVPGDCYEAMLCSRVLCREGICLYIYTEVYR